MLDISLMELTGSAAEEVLAHEARLGVDKRHHVLQLIAETEGAPWLVVSIPGPKTARYSLVQEPAIGQDVDGLVGCFHIHCAESVIPVLPDRLERFSRCSRSPEATHQVAGVIGILSYTEPEDYLPLLSVGKFERNLNSGAGIQSGPYLPGKPRPGQSSRTPKRAVTPKELSPVATYAPVRIVHIEESSPAAKLRVIWVARKERAAIRVNFGDHVHSRFRPQVAKDPFNVSGSGESA